MKPPHPFTLNDAIIGSIILCMIAVIFYTSQKEHPFWKRFYSLCPKLLLCYFIPALFNTFGLFSTQNSNLYFFASRFLLPISLVLLILPVHMSKIIKLGSRALCVFLAGTVGVIIGGPIALLSTKYFFPQLLQNHTLNELAAGFSTIAGSWIGGSANQTAMKEVFDVENNLFGIMLTTDVLVSSIWLMILLLGVNHHHRLDKWMGIRDYNFSAIKDNLATHLHKSSPFKATNMLLLCALGLFVTILGHLGSQFVAPAIATYFPLLVQHSLASPFFWLIIITTSIAWLLASTPMRKLEKLGASTLGSLFLYFLIASIGMKMDLRIVFGHPEMLIIGAIWLLVHATFLFVVAVALRAPFFFVAVGSQANIGGTASAPLVATAFHPSLAPVGVLLAVLGYAIGTYGAYLCGLWMKWIVG